MLPQNLKLVIHKDTHFVNASSRTSPKKKLKKKTTKKEHSWMRVPSYQRTTDIANTKLKILSTINQYSACLYKDKNYR